MDPPGPICNIKQGNSVHLYGGGSKTFQMMLVITPWMKSSCSPFSIFQRTISPFLEAAAKVALWSGCHAIAVTRRSNGDANLYMENSFKSDSMQTSAAWKNKIKRMYQGKLFKHT